MRRDFTEISGKTFDLVIVGGGIVGAGVVRDASLRGLKTLLLEQDDFGGGTTSRSTRLIHGGLRYLRHLDFGLVRQDMRERETLLKIAPHLVHPLPFLIPLFKPTDRLVMKAGMVLYDVLSYDKSLPGHKYFSRNALAKLEPSLNSDGLRGAYRYYDCQAPYAERLCLENIISAVENGATALNHSQVTKLLKDGNTVSGVVARDLISGKDYTIMSSMVVNAAGPWMDAVYHMAEGGDKRILRRTKGVHLLTRKLSNNALVLFASDARLFFVIPWQDHSLVGTTDTDYSGDNETVHAEKDDVDYLLRGVRQLCPSLTRQDIFYTYAGLRALPDTGAARVSNVSRAHKLIDHEKTDRLAGLISVIGGKITGYRAIAEEITDLVANKLNVSTNCTTASTRLPGALISTTDVSQNAKSSGLPDGTIRYLESVYGSRMQQVLALVGKNERGKQPLCPHSPAILAQIEHAISEESALTVADFMLRRSMIGLAECIGREAAPAVSDEMGRLLGWNEAQQKQQLDDYHRVASLRQPD